MSRRRLLRRGTVALVVGWLIVAGVNVARAVLEAGAGQRAALTAAELAGGDPGEDLPPLPQVLVGLREARTRFSEARRLVDRPSVFPLRFLPLVGRQLRSFRALAAAGSDVSKISATAVARVDPLLRSGEDDRRDPVLLLRQLADVAGGTERALAGVTFGPRDALVGALGVRRDRLVERVAALRSGLQRGAAGAAAAAGLLGGPRRYLVLAANNAEMRAGSGMFLSAGVLQADAGRLSMSAFRRTEDLFLPEGAVALDGDLAARWDWLKPNQEWRNLGVSPRFDVTAALAARMWAAAGGETVDGVLALDPIALRAMLVAVGPVDVAGRVVSADTVVDRVEHDQYVEFAGDAVQSARREQLGQVAQAVLQGLERRDWRPDRLGRELAGAARGRHVLVWSSHPEEQAGWTAAGVDGGLHEPSLLVAVLNRGGNKLDRFLKVAGDLRLEPGLSATAGELRVRLSNIVPIGEPAYVAGPEEHSGVDEGDYVGLVAVSVPGTARDVRVDGVESLAVAGRDGPTQVVALAVRLARGEERSVIVRFSLPRGPGALTLEPSARVPGVEWTVNGRPLVDGNSHSVPW